MVLSKESLRVKSVKIDYLKDYPLITKHDNHDVIKIYIWMEREEAGVVLRKEQVASDAKKKVQKPYKKNDVHQK